MAPNLLTLLVLVTGAVATVSDQVIANYCSGPKYITLNLNATGINGPFILPSGQAYVYNITGTGNSATIANEAANVGGEVPRLDLGTSTDNAILYWAVNNLTGDPFAGSSFNITSSGITPNVCQSAIGYDKQVHACTDNGVTLTLNMCSTNVQ
ncbi:hypothetical protein LTR09_008703 [Extremus antarcticus]|uniref:Uncharacterized protein n=1 Tax=Extremus antarcticus TaxID=702011 RepID=A0AAJ0DA39_9PEZI|nr:hypothetical protein LTR09_008703 [Extremus antarcticus]